MTRRASFMMAVGFLPTVLLPSETMALREDEGGAGIRQMPVREVATARANKPSRDATQPKSRLNMYKMGKGYWWKGRHEAKLAEIKASQGAFDVVMIGDSITHRWEREGCGANVLARLGKDYSILDLGFDSDHTEQVLWWITDGKELDGYEAKVVTLMIGTNNTLGYASENVAAAIRKIVGIICEKQPKAKILIHAILPRYGATEEMAMRRVNIKAVNAAVKELADGENVIWLDLNPKFPSADGEDYKTVCPDACHPNERGYEVWAAELLPHLKKCVCS